MVIEDMSIYIQTFVKLFQYNGFVEQSYEQILQAIGFADREAQLYLAGLKLGTAPASAYAKATSLNRVTAYNELEVMSERDIFIVSEQASSKCYTPVSIDIVAEQFEQQAKQFKDALPMLRSIQSKNIAQPSVRLLEGLESIEGALGNMLDTAKEVHAIFHDEHSITWGTTLAQWHQRRMREGIPICILTDQAGSHSAPVEQLQQTRTLTTPVSSELIISNDMVLMLYRPENTNPYAIAIEQPDVVALQQLLFEQLWNQAIEVEPLPAATVTPVAEPVAVVKPVVATQPEVIHPTTIESTSTEGGQKVKISVTP